MEAPSLGIAEEFFSRLYSSCGRSFPWREEKASPYGILVAEILLKQTRAEKVANVWPSLVGHYRNTNELADADPDELFEMIAVLGFGKQRATALITLASSINGLAGELPEYPEDLIKLPYVGIYTAHAVACFAFGKRVPVVDLSVVRIISRLAGVKPPSDIRRARVIWDLAWALLPAQDFKEHNYGLLDFGALVCKPRLPMCEECSLVAECVFANGVSKGLNPIT